MSILRGVVGQAPILGVGPHSFVRVEVRGIGGQRFDLNIGVFGQVFSHRLTAVRFAAIPEQRNGTWQLTVQVLQEGHQMGSADIFVVGEQLEEEVGFVAFGTEGKGADSRDAVVSFPGAVDRGLPPWGKGPPPGGGELKAGLVFKNQVRAALFS